MATTPHLALTLLSASQAQKEVVVNEFMIAMDALFAGTAISAALSTPPSAPSAGDTYIIAAGASGAWSGNSNNIAFYFNGWQFVTPPDQLEMYDVAATSRLRWIASTSTWETLPASTVAVLNDLANVTGAPTNGEVLTYNASAGKWSGQSPTFTATLAALTDVSVTEGSALDGMFLYWNNAASKWEAKAVITTVPSLLSLPDVTTTGAAAGWVMVYSATGPGVKFVNPATLTTVTSLSNVGDVSYTGLVAGDVLVWNGAAWGPASGVAGALHTLSDVMVTEGAGIDGEVLMWSQAAGKWVAGSVSGGGSSTLSSDTDVLITSPSNGQVLQYNSTAGKWENATISAGGATALSALTDVNVTEGSAIDGMALVWNNATARWIASTVASGSGGGTVLLPPQYELGPFAPPTPSWFTTTAPSGVTVSLSSVANVGMEVEATGFTTNAEICMAMRSTSAWGTAWSMTTRAVMNRFDGSQPQFGVGVMDSAGKVRVILASVGSGALSIAWETWNSISSFGSYSSVSAPKVPEWWRVRLSSGTLYFGWSYDGQIWFEQSEALTSFLADASHVGLVTCQYQTDSVSVSPGGAGALITYYDDPDYPAAGHTASTSAKLSDLSNVAASSPSDGQVLVYNASTSKWTNAAPASAFTVGTPPSVVQFDYASVNSAVPSVTMGSAPAAGNLLVAVVYTDGAAPTAASGWTLQSSSTTGLWYAWVLTKVAGSSEATTQSPATGGSSSHWTIGVWEVHGQNSSVPVMASESSYGNSSTTAATTLVPQIPGTLFLASLAPASAQSNTMTSVFGISNTDANLSSASGAHAAFGHCDAHSPTYGMLGAMSANCNFNEVWALLTA